MPLPSIYSAKDPMRDWNVGRAAGYGAVIGALAALFKTLGPLHRSALAGTAFENLAANLREILVVTLAFALLCAGAAALRNLVARRLIRQESR